MKLTADANSRYDCVQASAVEGVHFVAPDLTNPDHFYAVRDSGTRLWDEVYDEFEDGDRDVSKLEPNAFLTKEDRLSKDDRASEARQARRNSSAPNSEADAYIRTNTPAFLGNDIDEDV